MTLYLDTSCLLKLLFHEPESAAVARIIETEERAVVSSLARLEALSQIHARVAGGSLSAPFAARLRGHLDALLKTAPYDLVSLPPRVIELAEAQIDLRRTTPHCRTLDRLHLAIMRASALTRLLTNDDAQARVARSLSLTVLLPR